MGAWEPGCSPWELEARRIRDDADRERQKDAEYRRRLVEAVEEFLKIVKAQGGLVCACGGPYVPTETLEAYLRKSPGIPEARIAALEKEKKKEEG